MVGDPSGRSDERNLLSREILEYNLKGIRSQLEKFLDFETSINPARMVDNYDWFKNYNFLDFIRDVGKHITVNYMTAKDSVQKRLESGMSFTEFSYQLVQGYDFYYLYKHHHCKLQMGGSDQWGNITTGTELIRRMDGGQAFALTTPLLKKADGSKFGKTAGGNIWLDKTKTSPYKFYQYWINCADEDVEGFIKIFTILTKEEIDDLIQKHREAPHLRILQKRLAEEITCMVHSRDDFETALEASEILFGKGTFETLKKMDEETFLSVFEGIPVFEVSKSIFDEGINLTELLTEKSQVFPSKGEYRRTVQQGGLLVNKEKTEQADTLVKADKLLNNKYLLIQKGKKNYNIVKAV